LFAVVQVAAHILLNNPKTVRNTKWKPEMFLSLLAEFMCVARNS
jgi:hypothetical protein